MCVCELCLVDAGRVVCRERVGDQEAECGLDDEDLGIRTKEDVCIRPVCLDGLL
jgi:hypothetical protein